MHVHTIHNQLVTHQRMDIEDLFVQPGKPVNIKH